MKRIAVVAMEKQYAKYLRDNLALYLSNYAEFYYYSLSEIEKMDFIEEEFVVISTFTIFQGVKHKMTTQSELIVVNVTLSREKIKPLYELPMGTRALLVNFDYRTCVQAITNLYGAGLHNLELVPYFGEDDYDHTIHLAITPNEVRLVPERIKKIIDIGESVIDFSCLYHIAERLGVSDVFAAKEGIRAKKIGYFSNFGMERLLGENESLTERVDTLIKLMKQGIILADIVGNIYTCNEKAQRLLQNRSELLVGFNISELLPEIKIQSYQKQKKEPRDELICINGMNLIISVVQIIVEEEIRGSIITLDNFEEVEEKQHGIRTRMSSSGHKARYSFSDIIGDSHEIIKTIQIARRMAKSDSSVMIIGESGTGKEIFAQSIHNESLRSHYNFVAVNCAAIPENLLESEMFGYAEGAFTGAKRGGTVGYFELAHKGTIFLDEIGEMPLNLQSKLLRVIEERQITKVGSNKQFYVDVRIICATNKNLFGLVEKGEFREDLYYRLNVLPLRLPSLKERKSDIYPILLHFMKQVGIPLSFTEEAKEALIYYGWRGNIRELRNAVEFLCNLGKEKIELKDLIFLRETQTVRRSSLMQEEKLGNEVGGEIAEYEKSYILRFGNKIPLMRFVLEELIKAKGDKEFLSRNKLYRKATERGLSFTEGEIRGMIRSLSEAGFLDSRSGRRGTSILDRGIHLYRSLNKL